MSVTLIRDGSVGVILIDNPPVNAASHAVRTGLMEALAEANDDPDVQAIVLACAGRTFVAGADVKEFGQPPRAPLLPEVVNAIEASPKPVVAAVHGTALGGGFELALGAHARIASADAQFGLPEVKLGIIPGAGGTQRLPRLIGVPAAMEIAASGRRLSAAEAVKLAVVERIATGDLVDDAKTLARELIGQPVRRTGELAVPAFDVDAADKQLAAIEKKARGQVSPGRAARMVLRAGSTSLQEGLAEERAAFRELVSSEQSVALRHVFAAERQAAKVPGIEGVEPRPVRIVGVVGAGLMGAGIAVSFADTGFSVVVVERDMAALEAGQARIRDIYQRMLKSGRIGEAAMTERLSRLSYFDERKALAACDLVIEAVFDDLQVKQELFASLSGIVRPDAILATNTSYLDPDVIAGVVTGPERLIGLHFFSPANVMRLVEVVRTAKLAPDVLATGLAVAKKLGKLGVVSGVCEGFIGNRIFTAYRRECDFMLEDGALPQDIDAALEGYGFPMGPYAVNDMAGLDISWARRKRNAATRDPSERYVVIADRLCEAGRFGRKTGKGYYTYESGEKAVDPKVTALIEAASREAGIERRSFSASEIVERVMTGIVAEGRKILAEGIVLRGSDIDLVLINGYGYPAWRGGPMFQAGVE
ncbi:3-hydroxyacyl-CoA dehydrogenase [Mesorhizobium sp. Root552]|uniref:3-hydroxyacyl-CoA dehydrogenase NAD-binding domain-containing protein n=1 Tax=Mesorhizobium sp. Root552 TaxID=1736555 RepID=UPI0006FE6350|nr:3-hydroxyacyl-CoA dehydrogenase NAD-binding domain-containing protein [Mesorhizobium sp. Root552]KQZ29713.1 3-hydroxyacyl-CoA dehydrogenase [Mesorhizobium sp. Root552]